MLYYIYVKRETYETVQLFKWNVTRLMKDSLDTSAVLIIGLSFIIIIANFVCEGILGQA